jgi:hypothetical protein
MSQFTKVFTKSAGDVRSLANTMISNCNNFCSIILDVGVKDNITNDEGEREDITIYPSQDEAICSVNMMLSKDLAIKPLPQKALDEMAKKGLTPKKQPIEILLFIIVPCYDSVIVRVNNINDMIDMNKFAEFIECNIISDNVVAQKTDSSLKVADSISRQIFNYLKNVGIYVDNTEDDLVFDF